MHGWSGSLINVPYGAYLDHCYAWNLQTHFLRVFVANLKNDAIYGFYPESFCDKNLAIRKVFAFSDSDKYQHYVTNVFAFKRHLCVITHFTILQTTLHHLKHVSRNYATPCNEQYCPEGAFASQQIVSDYLWVVWSIWYWCCGISNQKSLTFWVIALMDDVQYQTFPLWWFFLSTKVNQNLLEKKTFCDLSWYRLTLETPGLLEH